MPVLERTFRFPLSVLAVGIQGKHNETEESRPQPYPWRLRFRGLRELAGRSGPRGEVPRREPQADYLLLPQSIGPPPQTPLPSTIVNPPPQTPETTTIGCLPVNFREQNRASLNLRNYPTRRERTSTALVSPQNLYARSLSLSNSLPPGSSHTCCKRCCTCGISCRKNHVLR